MSSNVYNGIPYAFAVSEGACASCGRDDVLADQDGRMLCETCWHAARAALPCWRVKTIASPAHEAEYGPWYVMCDYTRVEAEREAEARNARGGKPAWEAVEGPRSGERIAHPGYMARRRAEVLAAHPEFKR
jgi:hypothetical protein